ncbi:MAG: M23 family metallopeptidase [Candidatus Marinimicrobia bacterium]|nr:M23 family metallopeptidase [Candidatus Neomarinimicrobiota bacterium]MDD5583117.1 M23 family metallopeptidase [Candidatus Neomarinimicrobiota bacterium]
MSKKKKYTICLIPSDHGQQKMFEIHRHVLIFLAALAIVLIVVIIASYIFLIPRAIRYENLNREVSELASDQARYIQLVEDFRKMQEMNQYVRRLLGVDMMTSMDSLTAMDSPNDISLAAVGEVIVLDNIPTTAPVLGLITQQFDASTPNFFYDTHKGIDIACHVGTPVLAAASGLVVFSGWTLGLGNTVIINHGSDYITIYGHHSSNLVVNRESVERGQQIALSGNSGYSSGPHLHFEIWKKGQPVDPAYYIPEYYSERAEQ